MVETRLPELAIKQLDLKGEYGDYKAFMSLCYFPAINHCFETIKYLHVKELEYYLKLTYEQRVKSYLAGRYAAKKAVSSFVQEENLDQILIEQGVFHQPIIVHTHANNIQVSITHCDDLGAAIAFPEALPMGIDIERISVKRKGILKSQMTEREKEIIKPFPYSEEVMLTLLWTAKESLSKILKTGLTIPLEILEVSKLEVKGNTVHGYFNNLSQYCVSSLMFGEYVCSIAYPKNILLSLEVVWDVLGKIEQAMNSKVFINT